MNKKLLIAAAAGLLLAACSSPPASGTEHVTGKVTGRAALANNTTFALTYTGPVTTTGTFTTSNNAPSKNQLVTFTTKAGKLVLQVTSVKNTQGMLSSRICEFGATTIVDYTVDSKRSSGSFLDAHGSGTVTVKFTGDLPRTVNGCDESPNAVPVAATAAGTWTQSGPLTLR